MSTGKLKLVWALIYVLIVGLLVSCESTHHLMVIDDPDVENITIRGKEYEIIHTDDLSIGMTGNPESNTVKYVVSMMNQRSYPLYFDFSSILVQEGNYDEGKWRQLEIYTVDKYLKRLKTMNFWEEVMVGVAAGLNAASASRSTSTSYGTLYSGTSSYNYTAYTNTYNPAAGQLAAALTLDAASDNLYENQLDIISAQKNYLNSSIIQPGESYTGVLYTKQGNSPDYKISFDIDNSDYSFYFKRSDYKEVLNPWLDRSKPRHSILISYVPKIDRYGAYYKYANNKGFGGYLGLTSESHEHDFITETYEGHYYENPGILWDMYGVDPDLSDGKGSYAYDWRITPTERDPILASSFGFFGGITYKVFPYTWLMGGLGVEMTSALYTYGSLYYTTGNFSDPLSSFTYYKDAWVESTYRGVPDIIIPLQIGLNFITNFIDIGILYTSRGTDKPFSQYAIEVLGGIAF